MNLLSRETSPYLLQHSDNPVDWFPWSEEAIEKAKQESKPILLSIGYSACHWCHVMAHESFEDIETSELMNKFFVNIKLDREERPDLDKIYQTSYQLLTNQAGGWPLTVFINPDTLQPFFVGTYFPKVSRYGLPSFKEVLGGVYHYFNENRAKIQADGSAIKKSLLKMEEFLDTESKEPDHRLVMNLFTNLQEYFDPENGGFGSAPKFPPCHKIDFLIRLLSDQEVGQKDKNLAFLMADLTLKMIADRGLYDHLEGGFFRYSVDQKWEIPHFEKMLYDNAQLIRLYALMHMTSNNPHYKEVVLSVSGWMADKMLSDHNLFYSAIDADTDQEEGGTYVWSDDEIEKLLDPDEYLILRQHFGLDQANNFENSFHLQIKRKLADVASEHKFSLEAATLLKQTALNKLLKAREIRVQPAIDKKLLTGINALTISGLSACAIALNDEELKSTALECMNSLLLLNYRDGVLYTQPNHASNEVEGFLDDYAFTINAIMHTLELRWNSKYLTVALHLASRMIDQFYDSQNGGFYFSSETHQGLFHRSKNFYDDATPSGNAVAAKVLLRLGFLTGKPDFIDIAEQMLKTVNAHMKSRLDATTSLNTVVMEYLQPIEVVILRGSKNDLELWQTQTRKTLKSRTICYAIPDSVSDLPESLSAKKFEGVIVAYICRGFSCSKPINDFKNYQEYLTESSARAQ